jgi:hypothetical protein
MAKNSGFNKDLGGELSKVERAANNAMAEYLFKIQGKLGKANPKDTGRMASSWFISHNRPRTDTRSQGWAEEGEKRVVLEEFPTQQIKFDGTWYISNNLVYAERVALDPKWAKGGAGGADWYRAITGQLAAEWSKSAAKAFKKLS